LAVTDINLYLGRIQREWFPFELDDEAVERKLEQLCGQLQDSGFQMTPLELASGFLEIANHNMATAIRTVSVAKGYDPAEYLLMSFGGAGSQHCCSVAERLKMKKILDHPQSSILSAVGIRMADQSSHAVQSFVGELGRDDRDALDDVYGKLTRTVGKTLIEEGFEEREILFSRALDLRYAGTESSLTIAQPSDQDFRAAFEKAHQREFGYLQERLIEITSVRVDGIVKGNRPRPIEHPHRFAPASSKVRQKIFHRDGWLEAAVFARDQLSAGYEIKGPAIVTGLHSTTIIEPDWCAKSLEQGVLLIERAQPIPHSVKADNARISNAAGGDPVQLEIFNSHFASIAEQMGVVLQKTSSSVNVKERLDFSCAIFTGSGDLVVNAPHIPVHLGAMSETVRSTIRCNPIVNSGDVFVTNDPYAGGSHLPDVTVVTPVFDSHGRHLWFWVASRSHHAEMGGMTPGSMPANATRLAEEGVLIQNFRLIEGRPSEEHGFESRDSPFGVEHFDQLRKLLTSARYPSRTPDENLADIRAQVAANQCGLNQLRQLVGQYSFATVDSFMKHVQDAAEWKTRRALEALPDGHFEFSDEMDNGQRIRLKLEKRGAELAVDFSGTDPVSNDNLNANRAIVIAATMYVMRCLINEDIPLNEGVLKPVAIVLPVCFLNPQPAADPGDSPAIVGGNVETSQRIVDVLLGALDLAAASQGTMNNWLMGDETFGYYETLGGGSGATSSSCGASAVHCHMTNTRLTDPEVLESRYPVVLREFSIRRSSGGAGVHPGGDGMIRELEFRAPVTLSLLTSRRNSQPYGGAGGRAGHAGRNLLFRDGVTKSPANGQSGASQRNATELPSRCEMEVAVGDRLRIETPGGGGWGFPPHD
jgi:5-oxoprolinase (ATP-hydrolysing)